MSNASASDPRSGAERRVKSRDARAYFLGERRYAPIHALQQQLLDARRTGAIGDVVLLLEHAPVITLGRGAQAGNVLATRTRLEELGVDLEETGRGGDVTFHAPGQLVGYPILDLKPDRCDLRRYVRQLAEVMILIAREQGVEAGTVDGMIGVWVDRERPDEWASAAWARTLAKVGAIGVRVSRWITMHGFALNLDVDLAGFGLIVPCGISEHPVASLAGLTGKPASVRDVALRAHRQLSSGLDLEIEAVLDLASVPDDALFDALLADRPATYAPLATEATP